MFHCEAFRDRSVFTGVYRHKNKKFKEFYLCSKKNLLDKGSSSHNILSEFVDGKYYFPVQILVLSIPKGRFEFLTLVQIKKCDLHGSNQQLHHQEPVSQRTHLLMDWFSVSPRKKHWSQCGARLILEIYM